MGAGRAWSSLSRSLPSPSWWSGVGGEGGTKQLSNPNFLAVQGIIADAAPYPMRDGDRAYGGLPMDRAGSVTRLVGMLRSDDPAEREEAARQIWRRYFPQLLDLACKHLSPGARRREDEEDVVQNMYKSFCLRQQRGDFVLDNRADLWRLLVTMTLHKTRKAATRHTRGRRDYRREEPGPAGQGDSLSPEWVFGQMEQSDPTPDEAAALTEELERRLAVLPDDLRRVALWKLEGYTNKEIAGPDKLDCAERTVERKLNLIRQKWADLGPSSPAGN